MDDYSQTIVDTAKKVYEMPLLDVDDIPRIDLYMEQVTSFFDEALSDLRRRDDDKILTKTMINNYTKYGILNHPNRKKYNKEHLISLVYVALLKQVLTIQDIKAFFDMMPADHSDTKGLSPIYKAFNQMVDDYRDQYAQKIDSLLARIDKNLEKVAIKDNDDARMVMMISLLATEAAAHKLLAGRLLDQYMAQREEKKEKK